MNRTIPLTRLGVCVAAALILLSPPRVYGSSPAALQGELFILGTDGQTRGVCPLAHTAVRSEISGPLARVTVRQEFANPLQENIEAVYTFPLPHLAAVNDMKMEIGQRTVRAVIKRREEAQQMYETARAAGHTAALTDQERPNIFTHSVANIKPGEKIVVTLEYVETLVYEEGVYRWVFPMVVGPRYIPGHKTEKQSGGSGWMSDTDRVPDASRITPRPALPGTRAGHDVSLEVQLDTVLPVTSLRSVLHEIESDRRDGRSTLVRLRAGRTIPNRDFILEYSVAGEGIQDALLVHRSERGGFFTLILQPPQRVDPDTLTPKELVFVLDTSGSMSGFPDEKARETMKLALERLYPSDTFNLITFSGDTRVLFPQPVPATPENLKRAQEFLALQQTGGGTEMMKAIRASLAASESQRHVRVVCFMTDGYVGNDWEILSEIKKHPGARVFAFGIGNSVNRFLLGNMAAYGRGEVEYVTLESEADRAVQRFQERVRAPLLTDITIDWGALPVSEVTPQRIPDLFAAKPVVIHGRYSAPGKGSIRLKGKLGGKTYERLLPVTFPESAPDHQAVATLWARARIEELMFLHAEPSGELESEFKEAVIRLGLEHRLMTAFTSFVAVDEQARSEGQPLRRIGVPVETPQGVSYQGPSGFVGSGVAGLASSSEVSFDVVTMFRETPIEETLVKLVGLIGFLFIVWLTWRRIRR